LIVNQDALAIKKEIFAISSSCQEAFGMINADKESIPLREIEVSEKKLKRTKARILVVDDEKDMCNILSKFVKEDGYQSDIAHKGKLALGKIKKKRYDLIILDYRLPDISGLEVLREISQLRPKLPVIMISAYGNEDVEEKANKLGVISFLDKPFDLSKLSTIMSILLTDEKT
jgi:DNA-binding NtrC family response regulator